MFNINLLMQGGPVASLQDQRCWENGETDDLNRLPDAGPCSTDGQTRLIKVGLCTCDSLLAWQLSVISDSRPLDLTKVRIFPSRTFSYVQSSKQHNEIRKVNISPYMVSPHDLSVGSFCGELSASVYELPLKLSHSRSDISRSADLTYLHTWQQTASTMWR